MSIRQRVLHETVDTNTKKVEEREMTTVYLVFVMQFSTPPHLPLHPHRRRRRHRPPPSSCVDWEVYILPVPGDYDIRHRRKNENMQHGDDAHNTNNGDIKADANGSQSTRMGRIISRTAYNI